MEAVPHHLSVSRLCYLGVCWCVHWWAHHRKNHCVDIFHNGSLSLNNMVRWFLLRKTAWKDNEKLFIEISQKSQKVKKLSSLVINAFQVWGTNSTAWRERILMRGRKSSKSMEANDRRKVLIHKPIWRAGFKEQIIIAQWFIKGVLTK